MKKTRRIDLSEEAHLRRVDASRRGAQSRTSTPLIDRALRRVVALDTGCWIYAGSHSQGRPTISQGGDGKAGFNVYRVLFHALIGPVPGGLELHHTCGLGWCVNPTHLEAVTHKENSAARLNNPRCKRGHLYDYTDATGRRICRKCRRTRGLRPPLELLLAGGTK